MKLGELFRQNQPETALPWTGERVVTGLGCGIIEAEHFHRYFLAREFCRGKDVLDVASGEGYGSAFLAQTARHVIGVDVDSESVEHATREYRSPNLQFVLGEATKLPIEDHSVDAVVSFETIEHVPDHEAFLAEVKRVLRPDGFLIISTPDMNVYSVRGTNPNPFHVREMTEEEFRAELGTVFRKVSLVRQRAITGSAILPDAIEPQAGGMWMYEQRDSTTFEGDRKLLRAPFLLAVASDRAVPPIGVSLYIQTVNVTDIASEVQAEMERLRGVEAAAREQARIFAKAVNDAAAVPALETELERLRQVEATTREQARIFAKAVNDAAAVPALETELERLRQVEATTREQAPIFAKALSDAAAIPALEAELGRLRNLEPALQEQTRLVTKMVGAADSATKQIALLAQERDRARDDAETLQRQLNTSALLARQQALAAQRSQRELILVREEADRYKAAYQQAAGLLIPLCAYASLYRSLLSAPCGRSNEHYAPWFGAQVDHRKDQLNRRNS